MITIQTEVTESIYRQATALADKEHVSVERLFSLALAQALAAWASQDIIAQRAKRGSRAKLLEFMAQVPDVEPEAYDKL